MILNPFNRFLFAEEVPAADPGAGGGGGAPAAVDTTDGSNGSAIPPAAAAAGEPPPASTTERPEWFPEKYWKDGGPQDVEILGKSYQELQKAFSAKNPHLAEVPTDPAGYDFKPESLPEGVDWSPEVASKMAEVFHGAQIGQTQAKAIAAAFVELEAQNLEGATKAYNDQLTADREALAAKWGGPDKYEARKQELSTLLTDQLGADPNDATLFANPRVVEFLAKTSDYVKSLEKQLGEDALAAAKGSMAPGHSFTSQSEEATKIMRDPTHPDHAAYISGDKTIVNKVMSMLGAKS